MSDPSDRIKAAVEREFLHPSKRRPHYLERVSIVLALRELRHRVKPGLILDVGCGMKPYESLLNTSGSKYYGTDYPITMEGSYGDSTRADFFSDSMVLPFREGTFGTVISTQMLEHVVRYLDLGRSVTLAALLRRTSLNCLTTHLNVLPVPVDVLKQPDHRIYYAEDRCHARLHAKRGPAARQRATALLSST